MTSTRVAILLVGSVTEQPTNSGSPAPAPGGLGSGQATQGEPFVALVPPGVRLAPDFAAKVEAALAGAEPSTCLYTDFTVAGDRVEVGDWSVERSRWQDYTGPVLVVPSQALSDGPDRARLMAPRSGSVVRHLTEPLYQATTDWVRDLTLSERTQICAGLPYRLMPSDRGPRRCLDRFPATSLVIPTRLTRATVDGAGTVLLDHCLRSMAPDLDRPQLEVVVVLDADVDPSLLSAWHDRLGDRLVVRSFTGPFNFSAKINAGVSAASGEIVVLLNDDVAAITPDWLCEMAAVALESDVGAVAPLLLFADGTVQHRGHSFGPAGVHLVDAGQPADEPGLRGRNRSDRDVTGVTAACLVQRREVWSEVGGMDIGLPVAFNDVDYCERIRAHGLRVVLCNSVRMHHYESLTRKGTASQWEVDRLAGAWPDSWGHPDPLTPGSEPALSPGRLTRWRNRLRRAPGA